MTIEEWVTLGVIVVLMIVFIRGVIQPAFAVLCATTALMLIGVITTEQALAGFSNEAPIIVGSLLIFARAVDMSGVMYPIVGRLFGSADGPGLLARLTLPIAGISGFVNNTTLVAIAVPAVLDLSHRRRLPPSRFLIPVSYAAILGGVITAVGTSTNLVVSGLLTERGMEPLGLFEITPVGLPIAVAGCVVMVLVAGRLLPNRVAAEPTQGDLRHFAVAMRVRDDGPARQRTVEEAGLRHLKGVFLVEIDRGGRVLAPVSPDEVLLAGDVLSFVGRIEDIVDLQRTPGLESTENRQISQLGGGSHEFYEVVIGSTLDLVGRSIREIGFRARYAAAVLAIHRSGHRVDAKLGDVRLRMGDTLLVLAAGSFRERFRDHPDFLVIAPRQGISPTQPRHAGLILATGAGFVVLVGSGLVPMLQGALSVAILLVATGVISLRQARDALDLNIVLLIAAGFGLGAAVEQSGLGASLAGLLVDLLNPLGPIGALAGVLIATMLVTELITNQAAAVLMFPVAVATADIFGVDARPFVMSVALGASLSFLTPIGYQTNLMVFGLGQYRFSDFFRVGLPLNVLVIVLSLVLIPLAFPF